MLHETYFFDIPVYRCSPEQYDAEFEKLRSEHARLYHGKDTEWWDDIFLRYQNPGWRYNQIIGYLHLFIDFGRNVIKAEHWRIEQKRITRKLGKKRFAWRPGNAIEIWFSKDTKSSEIYAELLERLEALQKDKRFKNRYIDLSIFREIGPFIDWRALLDT